METYLLNTPVDTGGPGKFTNIYPINGYQGLKKALQMTPPEVIAEIKKSGLIGRSSSFPVDQNWRPPALKRLIPKYIVGNADEGEPGAFKDRCY